MIVADTSALISLTTAELLQTVLKEFDVHTTETVVKELEETAEYNDRSAEAAEQVLRHRKDLTVHGVDELGVESSRIDSGEGSCAVLARETDADFLITDDLRALPELQPLVDAQVATSPIVLKALVKRGTISNGEAEAKLEEMAKARDWLEAPIYRRAQQLFKDWTHGQEQ